NQECRHLGIGKALMQAVISEAKARNCGRLKWDVLPKNHRAKAFYQSFNAQPVHDWEAWILKF
ncbi:MAG: GNAT family N-acetyltransferase, partial [Gammaproteobacteria bacterium]|nr:GNAT family N-acetyltransferase [Gammaproteobacteria bacterium]